MTVALQHGTPDVVAAHWDLETKVAIIGCGLAGLGKGWTMTIAAMVRHAYDQIDQARTSLKPTS
jgi:hypothetical protein